jgi:hypothetical protein
LLICRLGAIARAPPEVGNGFLLAAERLEDEATRFERAGVIRTQFK